MSLHSPSRPVPSRPIPLSLEFEALARLVQILISQNRTSSFSPCPCHATKIYREEGKPNNYLMNYKVAGQATILSRKASGCPFIVPSRSPNTSQTMGGETDFLDSKFKPPLEKKLVTLQYPLSDVERNQVKSWTDLLVETEESLKRRSSSRRSVRRRARYFARKVHAINAELFALCSLSYSISGLPTISSGAFYGQLKEWWASKPPQNALSRATGTVYQSPPYHDESSQNSPAIHSPVINSGVTSLVHQWAPLEEEYDLPRTGQKRIISSYPSKDQSPGQERKLEREAMHKIPSELEEQILKRPRLAPQRLCTHNRHSSVNAPCLTLPENPTLSGDGSYLSFSFMRRHMINQLPEPFRTGMETSKLWKDEQGRGGLSVTNCLALYLPERINEDTFLVIRMGYYQGFRVSNTLGLGDPEY